MLGLPALAVQRVKRDPDATPVLLVATDDEVAWSNPRGPSGGDCSQAVNDGSARVLPGCGMVPWMPTSPDRTGELLTACIIKEEGRALLALAEQGGHRHRLQTRWG